MTGILATHLTKLQLMALLSGVLDPELPVSIADLGILRDVSVTSDGVEVVLSPTYSGCPAMTTIESDVRQILEKSAIAPVTVLWSMSPPWTSDWISEKGRAMLVSLGISAPGSSPQPEGIEDLVQIRPRPERVQCPHCHSTAVSMDSWFGATSCKALYHCEECLEPFEHFKSH